MLSILRRLPLFAVAIALALTVCALGSTTPSPAPRLVATPQTLDGQTDYWNQILTFPVPEIKDGKPAFFPGGRYYLGLNGVEIRFNNVGTAAALGITAVGGGWLGATDALLGWVASNPQSFISTVFKWVSSSPVRSLIAKGAAGGSIEAMREKVLGGQCLGITLPNTWAYDSLYFFHGPQTLASGKIPMGYGYAVPVWFEPCS